MGKSGSRSVSIEDVEAGIPLKFLAELDGQCSTSDEAMGRATPEDNALSVKFI